MFNWGYLFSRDQTTSSNVIQRVNQLLVLTAIISIPYVFLRRVRVALSNLHDSHLESIIFLMVFAADSHKMVLVVFCYSDCSVQVVSKGVEVFSIV